MKLHPLIAVSCLLLGSATELAAQKPSKTWFQQTQLDLGKVQNKDKLTATFAFVNPTGKPQRWFSFAAN